jgi:hypothetical protein
VICRCSSPAEHAQRERDAFAADARHEADEHKKTTARLKAQIDAMTPDASRYEIVEVLPVGPSLVLKVRFPSCTACAFEGTKVLVYLLTSPVDALKWRKLDPHFRIDPKGRPASEAPSPSARFPASPDGWADAVAYARGKDTASRGER